MADNNDINIKVNLDTKGVDDSLKKINSNIDGFSSKASSSLKSAFEFFGAYEFGSKIKDMFSDFTDAGSNLEFMSQSLHENAKTLSTWEEAAKRVGGTAQGFASNVKTVYDRLNNAALNRDPQLLNYLNILKVKPLDQNGHLKDTIQIMREVGVALNKMPEIARRPIAQQLGFDDASIRLFTQNQGQLDTLLASVQKAGVLDQEQAERATRVKQQWQEVGQTWTQVEYQLSEGLIPLMQELGKVTEWALDKFNKFHNLVTPFNSDTAGHVTLNKDSPIYKILRHTSAGAALEKYMGATSAHEIQNSLGSRIHLTKTSSPELSKIIANMSPIERAQMIQESGGNPNAIGGQREKELTYGLFQMQLSLAKQFDPTATPQKLLDPMYNKALHDKISAIYWKQTSNIKDNKEHELAVLAKWNGGQGGLNHLLKRGESYNGYAERTEARAEHYAPPMNQAVLARNTAQSKSAQPGNNNGNGAAGGNNINISNMNVMGNHDPVQWADSLTKQFQTPYAFTSGRQA